MVRTILAVLLLVAAGAHGQATAPAPDATAPTADASTPRGALTALTQAMQSGNEPAIERLTLAGTDKQRRLRSAIASRAARQARFREALVGKFGAEAADPLIGEDLRAAARQLQQLQTAPEKIEGDTATVTLGQQQIRLRKEEGGWKLPIAGMLAGIPEDQLDRAIDEAVERAEAVGEAMESLTAELQADGFTSVEQVGQALQAKLMQSMLDRQRRPATAPATQP